MLLDSDNVLFQRSRNTASPSPAVDPVREEKGPRGVVVAQIFPVKAGFADAIAKRAEVEFAGYRAAGVREAGVLVTLDVPNNFPRLPIRTDGPFLVWLGVLEGDSALEQVFRPAANRSAQTLSSTGMLRGETELVVLAPTRRSRLPVVALTPSLPSGSTGREASGTPRSDGNGAGRPCSIRP